jgi:hypothetical protein
MEKIRIDQIEPVKFKKLPMNQEFHKHYDDIRTEAQLFQEVSGASFTLEDGRKSRQAVLDYIKNNNLPEPEENEITGTHPNTLNTEVEKYLSRIFPDTDKKQK